MIKYEIKVNPGDELNIEKFDDKDITNEKEKWVAKKVYRRYVLAEKKVLLGTIRRCVCLGDLVRYGYAEERYIQ